jgi:hypothetical protein
MCPNIFENFPQAEGTFRFHPHPSRGYSDHVLSDIGLTRSQINAAMYVPTARRRRGRKVRSMIAKVFALMAGAGAVNVTG